ncbi:RNA 2',3'-cyclic phosphodiesterase [Paroceanicella profunda]|uniref:RNA 2',3'-cyclic phosphodiesterase n=1 Tax=Paroceanicella profunda TaxID=2579971 RepID=A0A5B8FGD5_9RHOB|nr:RNA 2',3'-cyclic phosphodiesterase [Paroceanicella profunda]QDL90728.1 RNA 2',3'-cyclic phosphodiesterase [Paroceanicella profunda]
MRLFAAIPLPEAAVARLEILSAGLPAGRPEPPENYHVTLGFFGECDRHLAEELHLGLEEIRLAGPVSLDITGLGMFGGARPRLLHAALGADPALVRLQGRVMSVARAAGLSARHARFVPHVTLARFRPGEGGGADLARWIAARAGFFAGPWSAESFCLYRSDPGRSGSVYTELAEYPFTQ